MMRRTLSVGCLALLVFCLGVVDLQARMGVILQQRDGVIASVEKNRQMVAGGTVTYLLTGEEVSAKAFRLRGQSVHILFYVAEEENYCVDLRPAGEPEFEIPANQSRIIRPEREAKY
jgi:hypothetical protein